MRLLSVPHCGTRFAMDVLQRGGLQEAWYKNHRPGNYLFAHFNNKPSTIVYGFSGMPTVIPLRDYEEVVKSWERRGKKLDYLESLWQEMTDFLEQRPQENVYLLRIDNEAEREHDLKLIGELLEADLSGVDFGIKIGEGT